MKKLLALTLVFLLTFAFVGCGKDQNTLSVNTDTKTAKSDPNKTVKIELPLALIDEEYRNDLDGYCKKYGYESVKSESGNSVAIKMKALSYDLLLTQIGMKTITAMNELLSSEEYPYAKGLESFDKDGFKEVVILVNKKAYLKDEGSASLPESIANCCFFFQAYNQEKNPECTVTVVDKKTKEIFFTNTYSK